MSKVFFSVTMSLDGFVAPEWQSDQQWMAQWSQLQRHIFPQKFFRENLKLGEGGQTGVDNQILEEVFHRTGTTILGKRMFDAGERMWPENAPFHTPVFVLTHQKREPWVRPGGTTFHFVNDGIESALRQARAVVPADKDIRIGGGGTVLKQYLNAGLVDEIHVAMAPVFLNEGIRLFEKIDAKKIALDIIESPHSPLVTHLRYAVRRL